ncbi:hypothetical protein Tco_0374632 [Tanacetum coccineum]
MFVYMCGRHVPDDTLIRRKTAEEFPRRAQPMGLLSNGYSFYPEGLFGPLVHKLTPDCNVSPRISRDTGPMRAHSHSRRHLSGNVVIRRYQMLEGRDALSEGTYASLDRIVRICFNRRPLQNPLEPF